MNVPRHFRPPGALQQATDARDSRESSILHELFEAQADLTGEMPALECGNTRLSYAELDCRANQLAHFLRRLGAGPGTFVGICFDRSEMPIIVILACHKAGAAYVPLDTIHPDDRLQYIMAEADIRMVLTESQHYQRISGLFDGDVVALDEWTDYITSQPPHRLSRADTGLTPLDVCYVLYTSGSTGRPKGIVAEHRNVTHFVRAFNKTCTTTSHDRVFQGFALGFDGSVEEIWMAFSNGACLVTGTKETPRFGNDLARFLTATGITYFSTVPTVLSTITVDLPTVTQIVVSGEACPPELVKRWTGPGRLMLNVYGPTEATVNTTAAILKPDHAVTIGQPLDGYATLILAEDMQPVPAGTAGELYVGGPSISRGYLGQPDLTERSFLRLYRTGDLARVNDQGELEFLGRIDGQVKIRGFRVELSEIEAVLMEMPQITGAAVRLYEREGESCIAAYVVPDAAAGELDRNTLLEHLRTRLPPYMVPAYLDTLDALPMLSTGKTDRKRLPEPAHPLVTMDGPGADAETPLQEKIAAVWRELFGLPKVAIDQHFFLDLGGHSLLAARLAASLREKAAVNIAVRDVYAFPTVRTLAEHVLDVSPETGRDAPNDEVKDDPSSPVSATRHEVTAGVALIQYGFLAVMSAILAVPVLLVLPSIAAMLAGQASIADIVLLVILVALAAWPALVLLGLVGKWVIIGRYRPGRYPLWGNYYVRWWMASWLQGLMGISALAGTPLAPLLWRAMGARIGSNCFLSCEIPSAWDCISIGDETSIGSDTQLAGMRIEEGHLIIGTIDIGSRCFVGSQCVIGLNTWMGDDCRLGDQSLLHDANHIPATQAMAGSPARPHEVPVPDGEAAPRTPLRRGAFGALQLVSVIVLDLVLSLPLLGAGIAAAFIVAHRPAMVAIPLIVAALPAFIVLYCLYVAVWKKIITPVPPTGVYDIYSLHYLQYWLVGNMMRSVRTFAMPIFTTIYLPPWMRLLGAKLGRYTEMATVWSVYPDGLRAGDGVFFADGCIIGPAHVHRGRLEIGTTQIGNASFVGNSALLPSGAALGERCLLGVLSTLAEPRGTTPDDTDWLGSPGFLLPNREKITAFDVRTTYRPTLGLYLQRGVIDGLRILLPPLILASLAAPLFLVLLYLHNNYGVWSAYLAFPPLALAAMSLAVAIVVALKWSVMGTFRPVIAPLWSRYVWRNEMLNGVYEAIMLPIIPAFFGTPLAAVLLRAIGCKVGRNCYIGSALFSEFDLIEIGDFVAINTGAILQTHLFEDRVMKSSHVRIGSGCSIGEASVVLYDTTMGENSILAPLSLLMKGEVMPGKCRWHGIPTV